MSQQRRTKRMQSFTKLSYAPTSSITTTTTAPTNDATTAPATVTAPTTNDDDKLKYSSSNSNNSLVADVVGQTSTSTTASLAGPMMSVATFAALNSLNYGSSVGATTGAAGLLAAAAVGAAGEGVKYYNDRMLAQKALEQSKAIYDSEKKTTAQLHTAAMHNECQLHEEAIHHESFLHHQDLQREAEQHLQDMTNQLREGQKEADRDLWEQQNTEKQSAMTVSALFLGCGFVLAVEGTLPPTTQELWMFPLLSLVDVYYSVVAACVAFLLVSVLAGMVVVKRMARFMLSRTAKQQETLRELRELANKQLRELQVSDDILLQKEKQPLKLGTEVRVHRTGAPADVGVIRYMTSSDHTSVRRNSGKLLPGSSDESKSKSNDEEQQQLFDVEYPDGRYEQNVPLHSIELISIQERLQTARHQFSEHLWEQPVLVMGWRPIGAGRHVVSFQEWYYYDKVSFISKINILAFKAGAICLIFALGMYVEAELRWGDFQGSNHDHSCLLFWVVLLSIAVSLFVYLEFVELMYPTPHWRDEFTFQNHTTKARAGDFQVGTRVRVKAQPGSAVEGRCLRQCQTSDDVNNMTGGGGSSMGISGLRNEIDASEVFDKRKSISLSRASIEGIDLESASFEDSSEGRVDLDLASSQSHSLEEDRAPAVVDLESSSRNTTEDESNDTIDTPEQPPLPKWMVIFKKSQDIQLFMQDELEAVTSSLTCWQSRSMRYQSSLEMVNIEVIKVKQQELFEAIDTCKTGLVQIDEICNTLGFQLPSLVPAEEEDKNNHRVLGIGGMNTRRNRGNQLKARRILREHSILQEAVVKLLDRLVRRQYQYVILEQKNRRKAHTYLRKVRKKVAAALLAIEQGTQPGLLGDEELRRHPGGAEEQRYSRPGSNSRRPQLRRSNQKSPYLKTEGISKHEWDQIMTGIFHDKFF